MPRASKRGLDVEPDGCLKVRLHSPPVEGAANAELVEVLADAFGVPRRAVTIVSGAHARAKRVLIDGISERSEPQTVLRGAGEAAPGLLARAPDAPPPTLRP